MHFTIAITNSIPIHTPLSGSQRLSFTQQVDSAILEAASIGDPGLQEEDDDSWLSIDAEGFESKLERTMGPRNTSGQTTGMDVDAPEMPEEDRMASEQAARLKDLANKVEKFVEGEGDIEGARFEE